MNMYIALRLDNTMASSVAFLAISLLTVVPIGRTRAVALLPGTKAPEGCFSFHIFTNVSPDCSTYTILEELTQYDWNRVGVGNDFTQRTSTGRCWRRTSSSVTPGVALAPDGGPLCSDLQEPGAVHYYCYEATCPTAAVPTRPAAALADSQTVIAKGEIFVSEDGETRHTRGRRHLTEGSLIVEPGDFNYVKYSSLCSGYDYNGSLVIDQGHFYVVGSPRDQQAIAAGCPHVATHAVFMGPKVEASNAPYDKEILIWPDRHQEMKESLRDSSHPLGTFQLANVIRAHESIDPSSSKNKGVYDIIRFNCVDFLLELGSALNVKIDAKLTSFITRRLLEDSSKTLVDQIRKSASYFSLFQGRNLRAGDSESSVITDEQVIQALVEKRTSGLVVE